MKNSYVNISKSGMILSIILIISLLILLFLITDYQIKEESNDTDINQYSINDTSSEINNDYAAEDCIILKKINTYYQDNYKDFAILSKVSINHVNKDITIVTINITSEDIDKIYLEGKLSEIDKLLNDVSNINKDIFDNSGANITELDTNIILYEDFNTILFTINSAN